MATRKTTTAVASKDATTNEPIINSTTKATNEVIMSKTNAAYLKHSGISSNPDQLIKYFRMSQQFLLGYAK